MIMQLLVTITVALIASFGAFAAPASPASSNSRVSLPVYGTTSYGQPSWDYRTPPAYYRQPVFYQIPEDVYYRPEPMMRYSYYPSAKPYKSDLYPYYYADRMRPYSYYNDDTFDSVEDIPEGEDPRAPVRGESLPVGQETWFEGDSTPRWPNEYDDVNQAFLQNLITYNNAFSPYKTDDASMEPLPQDHLADYGDFYGERDTRDFEDEDVRELKALAGKPLGHVPKTSVHTGNDKSHKFKQWTTTTTTPQPFHQDDYYSDDYQADDSWINWESKRSPKLNAQKMKQVNKTPKPQFNVRTSTVPPTVKLPKMAEFPGVGGQKEVVLPRPATPVRHPFPEPVMQMLSSNAAQKKRVPSVYDTIKQLLTLDEEQNNLQGSYNKPKMQKRYVSSEDDLVGELRGLKRRSTS